MAIGKPLTIVGLANGMIGGTILVLPVLGLTSGYIAIPLIAVTFGLISFYSATLIVTHLGKSTNITECIYEHFNQDRKYSVIYNIIIALSLMGFLLAYFPLIVKMLEGIFHPSRIIGPIVYVALVALVLVMRKFDFAEYLLGYGMLSVCGYLIFLLWAMITAPSGPNQIKPIDTEWIALASSLTMGYSIHDFIVQILIKNPDRTQYYSIVRWTYLIGISIYTFISYCCFAIINRTPRVEDPEAIGEYFPYDSWQVIVIEVLYLINLMTVSPEFLIILKSRVYQAISKQQTEELQIHQIIFYIVVIGIMFVVYFVGVKISVIIELNGSVIGFLYIFIIPILVHLKCIWYDKRCGEVEGVDQPVDQKNKTVCECQYTYANIYMKYAQVMVLCLVLLIGFAMTCYTVYTIAFKPQQSPAEAAHRHLLLSQDL